VVGQTECPKRDDEYIADQKEEVVLRAAREETQDIVSTEET
jgi:hypothetical protein